MFGLHTSSTYWRW